ncbi:MAG: hypothetical protein FP826_01770 [Sphingomonadales bacterium]|nr:hypothetical protein [Sphingomonadales bacterium]MBU3991725.1 hypothetical protein [Alphaproteobacteria bacterium]
MVEVMESIKESRIISLANEIVEFAKEISDVLSVDNSAESLLIKPESINRIDNRDKRGKDAGLINKSEKMGSIPLPYVMD